MIKQVAINYCCTMYGIALGLLVNERKNLLRSVRSIVDLVWISLFVGFAPISIPVVALFVWFLRKAWRQNH
jgi:hypothetical protein